MAVDFMIVILKNGKISAGSQFYEMQIVEEIETEEFDLPADYVTTEERFW